MCSQTLVTRPSQPVSNAMHNAPFPENDDRVACSICFPHDVFTSGDSVRELPGQDEVTLCQQRITSCPSEIQGVRAAMGRHERFRSELASGFEGQNKKANLDGDVLLSVWTDDKTSASWSTAAATGSCFGRSRNSRRMSTAAAPEKQPPQHESPSFENWRQQRTLRA